MRSPATLLALLLVFAALPPVGPAMAGGATPAAADRVSAPNQEMLQAGGSPRSGVAAPGVELSGALRDQYVVLESRFDRYAIASAIDSTPNGDRQAVVYRTALDRIDERTTALEAERRGARLGLANGTLEAETAIRRMGHVAAQAEALAGAVLSLRQRASRSNITLTNPAESDRLDNRSRRLEARLDALAGPVGNTVAASVAGHRDPSFVYVAASEVGFVLSTVVGSTYHREVYRFDRRDGVEGSVDLIAAQAMVADAYPELWNASAAGGRSLLRLPGGAVLARLTYPEGTLSTAVDVTNGAVYRERWAVNLTRYETAPASIRQQGGFVLRVNRTYAGGPLRIELTNSEGRPVDGRVAVEGRFIGRTGGDGTVWTVAPGGRGDNSIIVTAEVDDVQLPISVELLDEG